MIFSFNDYRAYLKAVFTTRLQKNKSYSIRGFAKHLGVSSTQLSDVLGVRKHLSVPTGIKIGEKLGLDSEELEYFSLMIQHETAKDLSVKLSVFEKMKAINQFRASQTLSLDAFKIIAEWYHIPILVLADIPARDFTPGKVAKRLGISVQDVNQALERLTRVSLLERQSDGTYRRTFDDGIFSAEQADLGLREFHKQMLGRAIRSIETQSNREKIIGSETILFDSNQIPEFKKITEKFFTRAVKLSKLCKVNTEVYHLGVQFFRVTEKGI